MFGLNWIDKASEGWVGHTASSIRIYLCKNCQCVSKAKYFTALARVCNINFEEFSLAANSPVVSKASKYYNVLFYLFKNSEERRSFRASKQTTMAKQHQWRYRVSEQSILQSLISFSYWGLKMGLFEAVPCLSVCLFGLIEFQNRNSRHKSKSTTFH